MVIYEWKWSFASFTVQIIIVYTVKDLHPLTVWFLLYFIDRFEKTQFEDERIFLALRISIFKK